MEELKRLVRELNDSVEKNRAEVAELNEELHAGGAILKRRNILYSVLTFVIAFLLGLVVLVAWQTHEINAVQHRQSQTSAAVRSNICNMDLLFEQSIKSSGNTIDLDKGLRPILVANGSPEAQRAVVFIDRQVANLAATGEIRKRFLQTSHDTRVRLGCPNTFITTQGTP